jgi:hypothetical protein
MSISLGGSIDGVDQTLTERYAAPPAWRRPLTVAAVVLLAAVALGWLLWAAFVESTPKVESQLDGFEVVDDHAVTVRVDVRVSSGTTGASCTVEALASDHSVVGELHFRPSSGMNQVRVRTDRRASAIDVPGCIADGQNRPR